MISENILKSAKKNIGKVGLKTFIYNELIKNSIYNKKNGKPFSKSLIHNVLKGIRENLIIEKKILDLINEMKSNREAINKEYNESIEKDQPHGLQ